MSASTITSVAPSLRFVRASMPEQPSPWFVPLPGFNDFSPWVDGEFGSFDCEIF